MTVSKTSNLVQRVVTGLLGGAALVLGFIWGGIWFYFLFFFLLCFGALYEFYELFRQAGHRPFRVWGLLVGVYCYIVFFFSMYYKSSELFLYLRGAVIPIIFSLFIVHLYAKSTTSLRDTALTLVGLLYIVFPLTFLSNMFGYTVGYRYEIYLGILVLIWTADTGAYVTGKLIGRTKLFPRISPGKTWEGAIGGILMACLTGFLWSLRFNIFPTWKWVGLAAVVSVFGIFGDLIESSFKRDLGVKDSGKLLPGHGGVLDRFDAFLFSLPFAVTYLLLF